MFRQQYNYAAILTLFHGTLPTRFHMMYFQPSRELTLFCKPYPVAKYRYAFVTINTFLKCFTRRCKGKPRDSSDCASSPAQVYRVTCVSLRHCVCICAHNASPVCSIRLSRIHAGRRVPQEAHKPIIPACSTYNMYCCDVSRCYANKCVHALVDTPAYVSYRRHPAVTST